ncbi:MAG: sensor hybrid histidine kinase [Clostridia bacterium]|nr:sensor hybrid histidine kinase [Clostridia bacterium]
MNFEYEWSRQDSKVFGNIFELVGVGIAKLTIQGEFAIVNHSFAKIVGYSKEELEKLHFADITYSDDLDSDQAYVEALLAGEKYEYSLEKRYIKKDGNLVWVNLTVTLIYDQNKNPSYFLSIIHDITDKKQTELELKKQAKGLFYSPVSIIITDKWGIIEYINPIFTQITGFEKEDVIGKTPRIQASGQLDKEFYSTLWQTLLKGEVWRGTFINKKKNGELYWEEASISPVFDTENSITHFVAVKEDITERRKAEQALVIAKQEAEKADKAKSIFIAHMNHEIRTPLNAILGFSELLLNDTDLLPKQKSKLDIIYKNGKHLLNIINEILEISKIEAGKMTIKMNVFDIFVLMEDLQHTFYLRAKEKNIALYFVMQEAMPRIIKTDEIKLRQIVINLIGNALKFIHEGSIHILTSIEYGKDKTYLCLTVEDTGIGIAEEDLQKIFDNFVQVSKDHYSEGGTGLGLSITKKFIENLGGEITVESEIGKGSVFSFFIPVEVPKGEAVGTKVLGDLAVLVEAQSQSTDKSLRNMPKNIKEDLRYAVLEGDIDEIEAIIEVMYTIDRTDAELVKKLSRSFDFEKILSLV